MLASAGREGGVGKTTVPLGRVSELVADGHLSLAVDADTAVPEHPGAAVVPSAPGIERPTVRRALRELLHAGPAVVVDCPADVGPDVADAVRLSDACVVVARSRSAGLPDAAKTAAISRWVDTPIVAGALVDTDWTSPSVDRPLDAPAT